MTASKALSATRLAWLTLAVFAWLAATAWARPLMLTDEGRYVGVAWEMLRSGDWVVPTLNGLPYFHKPPLFYWITAASLALFGHHDWAARAAPLLGATLAAMSLFLFMRRWAGERAARLSLVALLAQPLCYIGAQFANLDMLVAGCITATIVLLADALLRIEAGLPFSASLLAAYALAALGVLAKGLIGVVVPVLVIVPWLLMRRRWRLLWPLLSWRGALLFFALAAPWFAAVQLRHADFLYYFIVVQHFKRYAGGGFNEVHPFWYYPAALALFCLPWLPWLAVPYRQPRWLQGQRGALRLLMLLWVAMVVLFFSLPQSKPLGYVLPAAPPLAALFAECFASAVDTAARRRRWLISALVSATLGVVAVAWIALHPYRSNRTLALAMAQQYRPGDAVVMLDNYYYDMPYDLRLRKPVVVVDDWRIEQIRQHDNWRRELADAAAFAPDVAKATLVAPPALAQLLCTATRTWVIGPSSANEQFASLKSHPALKTANRSSLWRIDAQALPGGAGCAAGGLPLALR